MIFKLMAKHLATELGRRATEAHITLADVHRDAMARAAAARREARLQAAAASAQAEMELRELIRQRAMKLH